jgi:hypothetical protein
MSKMIWSRNVWRAESQHRHDAHNTRVVDSVRDKDKPPIMFHRAKTNKLATGDSRRRKPCVALDDFGPGDE